MSRMVVLVVDDQTSVVSGIVFGIDWQGIGIDRVLKGYNAFEAKEILLREQVDIMLCDIEMPVESGLDLFRWMKEQQLDVECIFLTAHADFMYIKQAMQLGGFDYIVQPARYKDIETVVSRAALKVQSKQEAQKYYDYGRMHYHEKARLVDALLRDWFMDREIRTETVLDDLRKVGISLGKEGRLYVALLSITKATLGSDGLDELLQATTAELFALYGQKVFLTKLSKKDYGLVIYPDNHFTIDKQGVIRQFEQLTVICRRQIGCDLACYAGSAATPAQILDCVHEIDVMRQNNVALTSKVYFAGEDGETELETAHLPDMKVWGHLLLNGGAAAVCEQAIAYLDTLSAAGQLTAQLLKRFYQAFIQMLYTVLEQMDSSLKDIFPDDQLDIALTPYTSIDDMHHFLKYIANYFETLSLNGDPSKNKNQIEQIMQYIRSNLDKDIRRTDIAEAVFLNPSYVSRLFRTETGMSLKEFITEEKIKMARALVRTTDLPISMVAIKMGYSNFSHFSQVYKKLIGVSPAEDRKR
ncbi:helix-turn-helix domain-containing protein [Paenibacillaceae bacterium]|nr:helix-turn-helix domain-containing protein [Paenibacillaceae bacterium]